MMAELQPSDQFLVNRDGESYQVTQANLMAQIQDDDLMLVNRDDVSYKITGAEVKDSFVDPIEITSVTISDTNPIVGVSITAIVVATGGKNPVTFYQWRGNDVEIPNATDVTYTPVRDDIGKTLDCVVTITDELGDSATATSPETAPVQADESVDQPTLLTPPNGAGLGPAILTPTTDSLTTVSTVGTTTTLVASDDRDLDILQEGGATMTDGSGAVIDYQATSNVITNITASAANPNLLYAIAPTDYPGTAVNNQTSIPFNATWSVGEQLQLGSYLIIDKGANYRDAALTLTPVSSGAVASGSNDLINWTEIPGIPNGKFEGYRYIWPQSTMSMYGGGVTYTSMTEGFIDLTLYDNQDLTYFKDGDVIVDAPAFTGVYYVVGGNYNVPTNPQNAFNGDLSNRANSNTAAGPAGQNQIDMLFNPPLTGTTFKLKLATSNYRFYLNSVPSISCAALDADSSAGVGNEIENGVIWDGDSTFDISNMEGFDGTLERLTFFQDPSQNYEQGIYGITVDGTVEELSYASGPYSSNSIISVDINNKQIIMSGGDFYATDGTTSGTGSGGDNQAQVWSSNPGNDWVAYNNNSSYGLEKAFDGQTDTNAQSTQSVATIAFSGLTLGWAAVITSGAYYQVSNMYYTVNDVQLTASNTTKVPYGDPSAGVYAYIYNTPVVLTSIKQVNNSGGSSLSLYGVMFNGQTLVDQGLPAQQPVGENKVVGPAISGTGRVSAVDAGTNTITVIDSNDNWISSGAWNTTTKQGNAAGLSFFLTGDEVNTLQIDPDDVHMTCTPFSGTGGAIYEETTWQIATDDDTEFLTPVVNVTNTNETFYNVSTVTPETDPISSVTGAGTVGDPYVLTLTGDKQLSYFDEGESVTSSGSTGATDLHGLRFDSTRATTMSYDMGIPSANTTLSFWIKPTAASGTSRVFQNDQGNTKYSIYYNADSNTVTAGSGGTFASKSVPLNEWSNCVVTYDNATISLYVNGGTATTQSIADLWSDYSFRISGNASSNGQLFDGYLSDVYFVDGQLLDATVFGETNSDTQSWVPKPDADVKAAIETAFDTTYPSATYNTSQVWSKNVTAASTYNPGSGPAEAFDGDLLSQMSTTGSASTDWIQITFNPALTNVNQFEVYTEATVSVAINATSGDQNSLPADAVNTTGNGWDNIGHNPLTPITSLRIMGPSGGGNTSPRLSAIKVDDKILVNGPDSGFGANGFYLPFDPAATGVNYSQNLTCPGGFSAGNSAANAFDGNIATYAQSAVKPDTFTFTPTTPIAFTSSLRVHTQYAGNLILNGGTPVTVPGQIQWTDVASGAGTLTTLTGTADVDNNVVWDAIEVDGTIIVNHNNIGVDDSGNNNDFFDQNFAVGNTSEVWSDPSNFTTSSSFIEAYPTSNAFDGDLNTSIYVESQNSTITWDASSFGLSGTVRVRPGASDPSSTYTITVNGSAVGTSTDFWSDPVTVDPLSSISVTGVNADGQLCAIEVNGKILVDTNIQDTVSDTPAKDFAILSPGSNGGLTTTSTTQTGYSTLARNSASKYYAEFSIVGSGGDSSNYSLGVCNQAATEFYSVDGSGGTYIGSAAGSNAGFTFGPNDLMAMAWDGITLHYYKNGTLVYSLQNDGIDDDIKLFTTGMNTNSAAQIYTNYGQQPFVAPNVTYNQDTGIVTLAGTYNTSQEWSDTTSTPVSGTASNIFDGDVNTFAEFDGANKVTLTNAPVTASAISIYQNGLDQGTFTLTINGNKTYTNVQQSSSAGWYTYNLGESLNITSIEYDWSVSGGYIITAMMADGQLLVDSSVYNTSQNWSAPGATNQDPNLPVSNAFDGSTTTQWFAKAGTESLFTFANPVTVNTSLRMWYESSANNTGFLINGVSPSSIGSTPLTGQWIDFTSDIGVGNDLISIQIAYIAGQYSSSVFAVEVDGKILVDGGGGTYETLHETEASSTVTGTVVVANPAAKTLTLTASDSWSGTAGNKVTGVPGTGLNADTIYRARVRQTSSNNIVSPFSEVNRFKTAGGSPDLGLSGLRFDNARETYMQQALNAYGTWTFSAWIKPTGQVDDNGYLIACSGSTGVYLDLGSNALKWRDSGTGYLLSGALDLNVWSHVVVECKSGSMSCYVNGALEQTVQAAAPNFSTIDIGYYTDNFYNGYMSDFYFVDNQALGADVFGESINNGTWVPKDSAAVKSVINVGPESPYDERPNTSVNWSSLALGNQWNPSYPQTNIFDGNTSSEGGLVYENDATGTLQFTGLNETVETLEIYGSLSGQNEIDGYPVPGCILINGDLDITAGGANSLWYQGGGRNDQGWVTIPGSAFGGTLTSIKMTVKQSGTDGPSFIGMAPYFNMIKVNGRPLINPTVINNSDNWSNNMTGGWRSPGLAFNGTVGGSSYAEVTTATTATIAFTGLTGLSSLRIYANINSPAPVVKVNQTDVSSSLSSSGQWVDVSGALSGGALNSLEVVNSGGAFVLYGIEADGAILVDAGYQFNTSEDWPQDGKGTYPGFPWVNAFRGVTYYNLGLSGTAAYAGADDLATLTFPSSVTGVTRIWMSSGSGGTAPDQNFGVVKLFNGGQVTPVATVNADTTTVQPEWKDCGNLTFDKIQLEGNSTGNNGVAVGAIEVDGKLLVTPGFGASGFYLPFDPAATGVDYSSTTTITGDVNPDFANPIALFDGSFDGSAGTGRVVSAGPGTMIINFGQEFSGEIQFWLRNGASPGGDTFSYSLDGGSTFTPVVTSYGGAGSWVDLGNITITEAQGIQWTNTANSNSVVICGLKVDGLVLVDHYSVGVDDSGNNNDFFTANFGIGNTSQLWSNGATTGTFNSGNPPELMFDGSLHTKCVAAENSSFTLATDIPITSTLSVYCGGQPDTIQLTIDGVATGVQSNNTAYEWVDVPNVAGKTLTLINFTTPNPAINAFKVDGKILINPSGLDTVFDTPLADYAVLTGGTDVTLTNGNLEVSNTTSGGERLSFSDMTVGLTSKVYAEYTAGPTNGEMLVGVAKSTGQSGSLGSTADQWGYRNDNGTIINNGSASNYGATWGEGDVIGILVDNTGTSSTTTTVKFFVNGVDQGVAVSGSTAREWYFAAGNNTQTYTWNFGQQPFVYATNNGNGTATVDGVVVELLVNAITQQTGNGSLFWDSNRHELTTRLQIANRYGITIKDHVSRGLRQLGSALLNRLR